MAQLSRMAAAGGMGPTAAMVPDGSPRSLDRASAAMPCPTAPGSASGLVGRCTEPTRLPVTSAVLPRSTQRALAPGRARRTGPLLGPGIGARGATDAVHVALRDVRQVVVDDVRDVRHVDAARGDVGGDQHVRLAVAERIEGAFARVLRLVAAHAARMTSVVLRPGAECTKLRRDRPCVMPTTAQHPARPVVLAALLEAGYRTQP